VTYLITFTCYGCRLHGSESGSIDRAHNAPGTPLLAVDPARAAAEGERMDQAPYHLDEIRRDAVREAIQEVCVHRGWNLLAAHGCVRYACAKQSRAYGSGCGGSAGTSHGRFQSIREPPSQSDEAG
jgi:hypothetical protein